jgi:polysaccharide biosynthesis/export protein
MQFGRFNFARGERLVIPAVLLALVCEVNLWGLQTATAPYNNSNSLPALPAAEPLSQAAVQAGSVKNAQTSNPGKEAPADAQPSNLLRLGPGDLLEISVYNVPELSTKARVGNSGDIYLPLIDYVHVSDLTVEEAQALIQKRLEDGGFVKGAHVTVFLDESASQGVTILGEVAKPGIYPVVGGRKLYDFISAAGGFSPSAGRKISVVRQHSQGAMINLNLPRNLAEDLQDDIEIFPGDTISVPRAPIVYVVGDVGHPAGLLVDNGSLTVLQALALAGGTNRTAKLSGIRVIHKGPGGMTETKIPLKKMLEAKTPDITLQADDILFVPLSGVREAASTSMNAAISAATGLAIVAAHP